MTSFVSQHKGAVVFSVAFHAAVVGALVLNLKLPSWQKPLAAAAPISGVLIDEGAIEREQQRREDVRRQEMQRRQRERQQAEDAAKSAAEQRQRDQAEAARREQARVAERQKADQAERERADAEKRRQEQAARETREREEAARAAAAQAERARQQAERDLEARMRADQERASAELAQYIADIQIAIESEWARPPSARPGLNCVVKVFQLPTGDVMDVQVASCNGDAAVVRSIEAAVKSASPLPRPKNTALFRRNLDVVFQPDP